MTRNRTLNIHTLCAAILSIAVLGALIVQAATAIAQNPVPFINQPLVPDATAPGGPGFTLTVNGAGFVSDSVVNWNGSPRATTFVSNSQLTAAILASDLAKASTAAVTVASPSPGGGASNTQFFSIAVAEASVSFLPVLTYSSGDTYSYFVVVADVNGDGKPDLLVANGNGGRNGSVGVLLGNGDGTFQPPVTYDSGGLQAASIAVADLNGDGKPDLVVANSYYSNTVGVLLGNGDGTFRPAVTYSSGGGGPWSVVVADVNGDGKPDILVANQSSCYTCTDEGLVGVLLGNGDGTFQPAVKYSSGGYNHYNPTALAVADLNGDGKLDLAVTSACGTDANCHGDGSVGVLLGNGDGTFQAAVNYGTGGQAPSLGSLAIADVSGDGKPDLLVANGNCLYTGNCGLGSVGALLGNGDGTFQPAVSYGSGAYGANSLAVADVNGEGKPDLVVANLCYLRGSCWISTIGVVGVLLGNDDGAFQSALTYNSGGAGAAGVAVADVNGDGRPDLLVANLLSPSLVEGAVGVLLGSPPPCVGKCVSSTALVSSPNPSVYAQPVTFRATVSSTAGSPRSLETVTFFNGLNVLGTAPLIGGIAFLTSSSLQAGIHTITAAYLGDANFTASRSPGLQQAVDTKSQSATTTALTSSLNPSIYGQSVTWTATVTTLGPTTPTGNVKFSWDSYYLGTASLNTSGVATLSSSGLNADSYPVLAEYVGDANNGASASPILNQVVRQIVSTATLTSSPNPSTQGQAVTFTAQITSPTVQPTGPVTFTAGKTVLGTAQLSNGKAKLTTSALPVGSTKVTATYYGDSNIAKSSASVTQAVQQ